MRAISMGTPVALRFGQKKVPEWQTKGFPDQHEFHAFQKWTQENHRNEYGDGLGTNYTGGDPLFYAHKTHYEYAVDKNPSKPWIKPDQTCCGNCH
ncbi:MAG TPA: hypothetical protein V6C52_10725 [Coleofasciculaceae cyanobacterium]|jgi:hypothetical protein